jgi:predicted dithiol-disulfide oxidoreductase (DUF899 family)
MSYRDTSATLAEYRRQIAELRRKMRAAQTAVEPEAVQDYAFATVAGPVRLSELFADKDDLFVIHNMGTSCPYCTLWADGFNGIYPHLASRAAFVVASPDPPAAQKTFAESRGWTFPMISHQGTTFAADMGYRSQEGRWLPGVSVFQRRRGKIVRVADTGFSPGDDFCALWHFLDLLPAGAGDWTPQFRYG